MAQRGISTDDVEYVIRYGQRCYNAGAAHYFLGIRNIPKSDHKNDRLRRLEGSIVLLDSKSGQTVLTVYRNKSAPKSIRCKAKYNFKKAKSYKDLPLAE
jgi:hypothetical protein